MSDLVDCPRCRVLGTGRESVVKLNVQQADYLLTAEVVCCLCLGRGLTPAVLARAYELLDGSQVTYPKADDYRELFWRARRLRRDLCG